jgi:hypothetical protein
MKVSFNRLLTQRAWIKAMPLVLFLLAVASYGLLIPWIGYIWDDFPVAWIADRLGSAGLDRYFSNNRPLLSWLYRISVPIMGLANPWHWHVFAILTRFAAAAAFYALVRRTWAKYAHLAVWAGLFFVVYPGFKQQWVSIIYGHFFLILAGLMVSFVLSVYSAVQPSGKLKQWFAQVLAWLLAFQNLLFLDYFFFLELARPFLLWEALRDQLPDRRKRFGKVLRLWLPFLVLWIGFVVWRLFTLQSRPHLYQVTLFEKLRDTPFSTLLTLARNILQSLWVSTPVAWGMVFKLPEENLGARTTWMTFVITGTILAMLVIYLWLLKRNLLVETGARRDALAIIVTGILVCLVGGWSIWLPGLWIGTEFATDRFSLVFMPGSALILAGILGLLPLRQLTPWLVAALFTSLAVGQQFMASNSFRREWDLQRRLFWQLSWRVPALQPGTLLLADELPFKYFTDNSLTAPVNWFYAPENKTYQMSYLLAYPARRLGSSLPGLEPGLPVQVDYLAAAFTGSTSQVVGLVFKPPACLRILDPELDVENKMLPEVMREVAVISSIDPILTAAPEGNVSLPDALYGEEPARGWCFYFEKAELARQQKDWAQVAALGDQAFATGDYPNDPMERIVFIEGYAQVGNWNRVLELFRESNKITPKMVPILCKLHHRITASTPASPEKEAALGAVLDEMSCVP